MVKPRDRIENFDRLDLPELAVHLVDGPLHGLLISGDACERSRPSPRSAEKRFTASGASTSRAVRNLRPSPTTTASAMRSWRLSASSMFLGGMFFPPTVMRISFFRPVMWRNPLLVESAEIARVEPAVDQGLRGRLWLLVVAEEHGRPLHEDLAVVRDLHVHAWHRRPHEPSFVLPGTL